MNMMRAKIVLQHQHIKKGGTMKKGGKKKPGKGGKGC